MSIEEKKRVNDGPIIRREKKIVSKMVRIYCNKKHRQNQLCEDCSGLQNYAFTRLTLCRFGEEKLACAKCPIHCYKPEFRKKIREVMRFAGPWMLLYDPIEAIKHIPLPFKLGK
jgi:hypothetical protein